MLEMTPAEWSRVGEAIVVWSGWRRTFMPARRWDLLGERFGDEAPGLAQKVHALAEDFYASDARYVAADLVEMGAIASRDFAARHPHLPAEAVEALAWCYTFDHR